MKSLEIFNRENRKWIAQIQVKEGKFSVQAKDQVVKLELEEYIRKTISSSLRHVGTIHSNEAIREMMVKESIEAIENNLPILDAYLSKNFSSYRFVLAEDGNLKEKEEAEKIVKSADYLNVSQREKILRKLNESDEKEIILLISDIYALDRLSKL